MLAGKLSPEAVHIVHLRYASFVFIPPVQILGIPKEELDIDRTMAGPLPVSASTEPAYPTLDDVTSLRTAYTNGHHEGTVNGVVNGEKPAMYRHPYTPKDAPLENFRKIKVIVIGAGYSGIYYGIRIPERLRNVDLTIYEKNDGVGGTWWENRYPGWWAFSEPIIYAV